LRCPVYGLYGENDERVNATIPKAKELMKAAGKKYEPVIYKGAGHGFMRSGEKSNPNFREGDGQARDEAWMRWKTLLKQLSWVGTVPLRRPDAAARRPFRFMPNNSSTNGCAS